jgi:hypothetical protein
MVGQGGVYDGRSIARLARSTVRQEACMSGGSCLAGHATVAEGIRVAAGASVQTQGAAISSGRARFVPGHSLALLSGWLAASRVKAAGWQLVAAGALNQAQGFAFPGGVWRAREGRHSVAVM